MKNPLINRLPRELKKDLGKYAVIFFFLVMLISLISAFLVADISLKKAYDEGFSKYKLEWGHFTFSDKLPDSVRTEIEKNNNLTIYDYPYFQETVKDTSINLRVYNYDSQLNLPCLMEGAFPTADDEIALERLSAVNNNIAIGDKISILDKDFTVTGYIALPNYSCLFENNSDMMFDAKNFSVGIITDKCFNSINSSHYFYSYSWMYDNAPDSEIDEKEKSDALIDSLKDIITEYDEKLVKEEIEKQTESYKEEYAKAYTQALSVGKEFSFPSPEEYINIDSVSLLDVKDYLPRYLNKAVNFTGEDMDSDKGMFLLFDYIVTIILAFVFAVTISNTINQEASVIGTLRASGYSKNELLRHYMVLPSIVSIIAAIIGTVLGYTAMLSYMESVYYTNYSLPPFEIVWNLEAFLLTTVIPLALMFIINLIILTYKLRLSPLRFIRHDLGKRTKKKALKLNSKISFMTRFRLRIILQNLPNYFTLFFGIICAAVIVVFGLMFIPLLKDYSKTVSKSMICKYQYVLTSPVETDVEGAEKYCVTSLKTLPSDYMEDEITVYGIEKNSSYIHASIDETSDSLVPYVYVSNGLLDKFGLHIGDEITYKDPYSATTYSFAIKGEYKYDAALAVFMNEYDYKRIFEKEENYFSGYFSDKKLVDIDDKYIATIVDENTLLKVSNQLQNSLGGFVSIFQFVGVAMFLLLMYLLSKQVIEKNAQSISMTKILGFKNSEIGSLYIVSTSIVVVLSLLAAIPLVHSILGFVFKFYLYKVMTGYIPFDINPLIYPKMFLYGIISYGAVAVIQMIKISKIPKSDALKNVE